jgi:hypothetical protein
MLKSEFQIPPGMVHVEDLDRVHLQFGCIETDNLSTERDRSRLHARSVARTPP